MTKHQTQHAEVYNYVWTFAEWCIILIQVLPEVNFSHADWLKSKYLKVLWADFVCEAWKFFLSLFSRIIFTWSSHFKELQLQGSFFVVAKICTVASSIYEDQNCACNFFHETFFWEVCTAYRFFLNPNSEKSRQFSL